MKFFLIIFSGRAHLFGKGKSGQPGSINREGSVESARKYQPNQQGWGNRISREGPANGHSDCVSWNVFNNYIQGFGDNLALSKINIIPYAVFFDFQVVVVAATRFFRAIDMGSWFVWIGFVFENRDKVFDNVGVGERQERRGICDN